MVIQGIKDKSTIWRHKVAEKQGCGDEGETREAREGKQGERDTEMGVHGTKGRSRRDPGKIHRSRGFGVQECWKWEKSGGTRTARYPKGEGNQGRTVKGFLQVSSGEQQG